MPWWGSKQFYDVLCFLIPKWTEWSFDRSFVIIFHHVAAYRHHYSSPLKGSKDLSLLRMRRDFPSTASRSCSYVGLDLHFFGFPWVFPTSEISSHQPKQGCVTWSPHVASTPCTAEVLISRLNKSPRASAPKTGMDRGVFYSTPWDIHRAYGCIWGIFGARFWEACSFSDLTLAMGHSGIGMESESTFSPLLLGGGSPGGVSSCIALGIYAWPHDSPDDNNPMAQKIKLRQPTAKTMESLQPWRRSQWKLELRTTGPSFKTKQLLDMEMWIAGW